MDKYKLKNAFSEWVSPINLKKLSFSSRKQIQDFNQYHKKLSFSQAIFLFLYGINEEKESLRELNSAFISKHLQKQLKLETISHSQLSRTLQKIQPEVLYELFGQLLKQVQLKQPTTKQNSYALIDSSTFSFSQKSYQWATFRKTKSGVKLHMKVRFMDKDHIYPEDFTITHGKEHDVNQLEILTNQPETTYVFDRGYLDFQRLDTMHWQGYFFLTRIRKNTKVHVLENFDCNPKQPQILSDQLVTLGANTYITSRFRLVTAQDDTGKTCSFLTNRLDLPAHELAEMYRSRWQIELFFKHIKQHMTIKKFYSTSEQGVTNQLILTMIAYLLTYLMKLKTKTKQSIFQIKRLFRYVLFEPVETLFTRLVPI